MPVASAHPTHEQLAALIQGTVSDQDNERLTCHLEECDTCQQKLQTIATGAIPVVSLVSGLKELSPTDQSALTKRVLAQVGGIDPGPENAECYVPVSVEGVQRPDMVIRGDGAVTLPLSGFASSSVCFSDQICP